MADTQNATKPTVDKNCNATAVEHNHPSKYTETFKFTESKWILVIYKKVYTQVEKVNEKKKKNLGSSICTFLHTKLSKKG